MLFYPNLPKIIGSDFLETRIRSIHSVKGNASACHVFGHTHFCWDTILDGIRYYLSSESLIMINELMSSWNYNFGLTNGKEECTTQLIAFVFSSSDQMTHSCFIGTSW